jgi:hypothetical protein
MCGLSEDGKVNRQHQLISNGDGSVANLPLPFCIPCPPAFPSHFPEELLNNEFFINFYFKVFLRNLD